MGVRSFTKKLKRAFPDVVDGQLNIDNVKIVHFTRGERQLRLYFTAPNTWRLTSSANVDVIFSSEDRAFAHAVSLLALPTENAQLIAYTELGDQLWREFNDRLISETMMDLEAKMVEEEVVRKNDSLFQYRPILSEPNLTARISIQCEPGWFKLIGDCIDKMRMEMQSMEWADHRLKITCVKEKFAGLRIYYSINRKDGESVRDNIHESILPHLDVAETIALNTCEVCGKHGEMKGGLSQHMQTLCEHHAKLRGRTETPEHFKQMFTNPMGFDFSQLLKQEENDKLRIRGDGSPNDGKESPA